MSERSFNLSCCVFAGILSIPVDYLFAFQPGSGLQRSIIIFAVLIFIVVVATRLGTQHAKKSGDSDHGFWAAIFCGLYITLFISVAVTISMLISQYTSFEPKFFGEMLLMLVISFLYTLIVAMPLSMVGAGLYNLSLFVMRRLSER